MCLLSKAAVWGLAELANLCLVMFDAFLHYASFVQVHFLYRDNPFESGHSCFQSQSSCSTTLPPITYELREVYDTVHVSSAYLKLVELWNKSVEKLKLLLYLFYVSYLDCITKQNMHGRDKQRQVVDVVRR